MENKMTDAGNDNYVGGKLHAAQAGYVNKQTEGKKQDAQQQIPIGSIGANPPVAQYEPVTASAQEAIANYAMASMHVDLGKPAYLGDMNQHRAR